MCARFNVTSPEKLNAYFQGRLVFDSPPRYNIAPSDAVEAVIAGEPSLAVEPQRWGMHLGHRPQPVINLRSENSMVERSFGRDPRFHRCLIPATGFFEWRTEGGVKQPYNFVMADGEAFVFAGLSQTSPNGPPECVILTCEPNELVAHYHDRMPSILAPSDAETWLFSDDAGECMALARAPFSSERMAAFPVTRKMGNPRFQEASAVIPDEPANPSLF